MEPINQFNENMNVEKPKKVLLIPAVVVLAAILAIVLIYFLVIGKPQFIFNTVIDKAFKCNTKTVDTMKLESSLKVSAQTEEQELKAIFDEVNKCTLNLGYQVDAKSKEQIIDLGLKYDKQSVIDAEASFKEGNIYVYLDEIYNKKIKGQVDEETKESLDGIYEVLNSKAKKKNADKALGILGNELSKQLNKEGDYEKEKETIKIADKEQKLTKSSVTLTEEQWFNVIIKVLENLKDNKKFMDCFEEGFEQTTDETIAELKEIEFSTENTIKLSIYTKGIFNTFKGIEVEGDFPTEKLLFKVTVLKEEKGVYTYDVTVNSTGVGVNACKGKVTIKEDDNEGKMQFTLDIMELADVQVDIDYSIEYDEKIDPINTDNSVTVNEITETEATTILENIQKRPLIGDMISLIMNSNFSSSGSTDLGDLNDSDLTIDVNGNSSEITDIQPGIESIYNSTDNQISVEPENNSITNTTIDSDTSSDLNNSKNTVSSYGYSVSYSVPAGFSYESSYSSDSYKYYSIKDDDARISATACIRYKGEEDYKKEIQSSTKYFRESSSYKNVKLDDIKTVTVGGKQFKYQMFNYQYNSQFGSEYDTKYKKAYVWYKLSDDMTFTIELEATKKDITEDIIKGFLNIETKKTNY